MTQPSASQPSLTLTAHRPIHSRSQNYGLRDSAEKPGNPQRFPKIVRRPTIHLCASSPRFQWFDGPRHQQLSAAGHDLQTTTKSQTRRERERGRCPDSTATVTRGKQHHNSIGRKGDGDATDVCRGGGVGIRDKLFSIGRLYFSIR